MDELARLRLAGSVLRPDPFAAGPVGFGCRALGSGAGGCRPEVGLLVLGLLGCRLGVCRDVCTLARQVLVDEWEFFSFGPPFTVPAFPLGHCLKWSFRRSVRLSRGSAEVALTGVFAPAAPYTPWLARWRGLFGHEQVWVHCDVYPGDGNVMFWGGRRAHLGLFFSAGHQAGRGRSVAVVPVSWRGEAGGMDGAVTVADRRRVARVRALSKGLGVSGGRGAARVASLVAGCWRPQGIGSCR